VNGFSYVYILQSELQPDRHYTGCTENLRARLKTHNSGHVPHTAKFRPWSVQTALAFRDAARARAFERYLKSSSGRAFARKHL
jgi:predicted GIY-YIG superfamily endonuclease